MNDDNNRRHRDEKDNDVDKLATVELALQFINNEIMSEKEALKYFNLPKEIFERLKSQIINPLKLNENGSKTI